MLDEVVADREHDVGLVEAGHLVVARLEPDRAERLRVVVGSSRPLPMNVSATGMPVERHELAQRRGGAGAHDAVAGERNRVERAADQVGGLQQLARGGLGLDGLAARQRLGVDLRRHHVLGQLDVRRARLLGLGDLERLAHDLGDDRRVRTAARSTS